MKLFGTFYDVDNQPISVTIINNGDTTVTKEIGINGLYFSDESITIESEVDSMLEHILKKSCSINFVTDGYFADDLFAANSRSIIVNIFKANQCIFAGYGEPNTFDQPFANVLESFTLNCTDALTALQYTKYQNTTINNYDDKKVLSSNKSLKSIIETMFTSIFEELNITDTTTPRIIYDRSKAYNGSASYIFSNLAISDAFIFGEEFDDVWTNEEVLDNILKYLNLHIVQEGFDFYIFDWQTLKQGRNDSWVDILSNEYVTLSAPQTITLTSKMHGADDTTITVDDVYNQVSVKCDINKFENVITSPLEENQLTSPFSKKQLYMREYECEGNGENAYTSFKIMIYNDNPNTSITVDDDYNFNHARYIDWYFRPMDCKNWIFDAPTKFEKDTNGQYWKGYKVPYYIGCQSLTSGIFRFGCVTYPSKKKDNSPQSLSMKDYLYISVNGAYTTSGNNEALSWPDEAWFIRQSPVAEYIGTNGGGVFSPSDDNTINYLVFSGKILLQPTVRQTADFETLKQAFTQDIWDNTYWHHTVPSEKNGDGKYYTRKFYTMDYCTDEIDETKYIITPITDISDSATTSLQPPTEDKQKKEMQYKYTSSTDYIANFDMISKIQVLECELIIGNKRLIEKNIDEYGNSTFEWVVIGQEPSIEVDGETIKKTTFSLGFNPKIDDYIIGQEHDIQNTINFNMGLDDVKGTAIPIKKTDNLSGAVEFKILGPINSNFNDITRRHPTWFRSEKFYNNNKTVLGHVQNIIISDFEAKIYSNNGGNEVLEDNDLIYMSNETDKYINALDDIDFKIITQPTPDVCREKGIKYEICSNAVLAASGGTPITQITNRVANSTAEEDINNIPENFYVDDYYKEYSTPKIIMSATMHNQNINWRNKYHSNVLNKDFIIMGLTQDVRQNKSTVKFKQI